MIEDLKGGVQNEKSNSKTIRQWFEQFTNIERNRSATKHNTQNEKKERSLDNMSLKNAELLYNFANGIFSDEN